MAFGLLLDPWISEIYDFKVLAPLEAEGPPPKKNGYRKFCEFKFNRIQKTTSENF